MHDAIVIGAGPSGLCAAGELHRRGLDTVLLERRPGAEPGTRAIGVHPPVLAALEPSGATERILAEAVRVPGGFARTRAGRRVAAVRFDRSRARFPFVAAVPQAATEAALAYDGPPPVRSAEALRIISDAGGARVLARVAEDEVELRARAVIVAVGAAGRGLVVDASSLRGRGHPPDDRYLMSDLPCAPGEPPGVAVLTLDPAGIVESFPLPGGGRRLVAWDGRGLADADDPILRTERLRRAILTRTANPGLAAEIESATAFGIRRVLLPGLRRGAVFVIGDAAHEISPIGGQGMNLGLLDAVTLAPALAERLRGGAAARDAERALDRWEHRRLRSARTAARLASLNTRVGRGRGGAEHLALTALVGTAVRGPVARLAAHAYAMGFDRDATR